MSFVRVCTSSIIAGFPLTCGKVEPNPGPGPGRSDRGVTASQTTPLVHTHRSISTALTTATTVTGSYSDPSPLGRFQAELSHTLNPAITRKETTGRQQGHNLEQRLWRVEDKIDRRLRAIEDNQEQLHSDMRGFHSQCQSRWEQNEDLRSSVNHLTSKRDSLENQNRNKPSVFRVSAQ